MSAKTSRLREIASKTNRRGAALCFKVQSLPHHNNQWTIDTSYKHYAAKTIDTLLPWRRGVTMNSVIKLAASDEFQRRCPESHAGSGQLQ